MFNYRVSSLHHTFSWFPPLTKSPWWSTTNTIFLQHFALFPAIFQRSGCHIYFPQARYSTINPTARFSTLRVQFPRPPWSCLIDVLEIEISKKKKDCKVKSEHCKIQLMTYTETLVWNRALVNVIGYQKWLLSWWNKWLLSWWNMWSIHNNRIQFWKFLWISSLRKVWSQTQQLKRIYSESSKNC